jgi:hypothetical protein
MSKTFYIIFSLNSDPCDLLPSAMHSGSGRKFYRVEKERILQLKRSSLNHSETSILYQSPRLLIYRPDFRYRDIQNESYRTEST